MATHEAAQHVHGFPPPQGAIPVYEGGQLSYWIDRVTYQVIRPEYAREPVDFVKLLHAEADQAGTISKCYFIGGGRGPVKIGYSVDPKSRLRAIQYYSPAKLSILALASGGQKREAAYHIQFERHRLHGEWFTRSRAIQEEIERLTKDSPHV